MRSIYNIILAGILLAIHISTFAQDCEKDISTNPLAPYNNHPFPQGRYNPWLNSDFNIGALENGNVPPMPLNNQISWQISDFVFGNAFDMWNPYTSDGTSGNRYLYLHPTGVDFEYLDYKWEDGWEVLHVGLGFYPNGEPIHIPNAQRAYSSGVNAPSNTRVPYIMLYNRYRGTLRVFMNLFTSFGGYSDIQVWLTFDDPVQGLSGILRHLESFDRPLDQTTNVKMHQSYNPNAGGSSRWFSADFQLGYDPCICGKNQKWRIELKGIETFNVNLYGRGVTVELPISNANGNPNYNVDWLSSNGLQDGLTGGNQIFTKMEGLVEDYKDALLKYEQDSQEYADYLEKKAVMDAFKGFIVDGISGVIPAAGPLKSWFLKPKPSSEDVGSNFGSYIKGASKGLLGYGYDQLSMGINPKSSAPKAPDMPTASYSEMRFGGTIGGTSQAEIIGPFFIPGSYNESSSLSNLTAFNYPAYNAPLGLATLLQTALPTLFYETDIEQTSSSDPSNPVSDCEPVFKTWVTESNFRLRFEEELKVALNPSLDFDLDRTATYIQIEVILENDIPASGASETISQETLLAQGSNLTFERFVQLDEHQRRNYQSKWILLEDLNQYDFGLNMVEEIENETTHSFGYANNTGAFCSPDVQAYSFFDVRYRLVGVKMKILHDNYFDQIGSNGEQVNTTQVFAYDLLNSSNGTNVFGIETGWINNESEINENSFGEYIAGTIEISDDFIGPTHPLVHEVIGNEIFINAQEVIINGPIQVQPGYFLIIQALEQIHMEPGSSLNPKVQLRIKKDFYDTPVFEYADNATVSSFCNNSDAYQANTASKALRERIQAQQEEAQLDEPLKDPEANNKVALYPNPANGVIQLRSSDLGISQVDVYDIAGRLMLQQNYGADSGKQVQMDIQNLQSGVYIMQIHCGAQVHKEKLVVGL